MKFIEVLQEHKIQYKTEGHHHTRPGWINFDCPWCGRNSHKWHMGYNVAFGYCNCWRCGRHGTYDTVAEVLDIDFREAKKILKGIELSKEKAIKKRGKLILPKYGQLREPHRRYLTKRRGFDVLELMKLWEIGGIGPVSPEGLTWRIFIPIHYHGEVVSWTTRSISDKVKGKYKTAHEHQESISHHELLYGEDYVRGTALVFEGPLDVWAVGPGSVCTFGTQWSLLQLFKLTSYARRVICFDSEGAAQARALELKRKLDLYDGETHNVVLRRKGRNLSQKEIDTLRSDWL